MHFPYSNMMQHVQITGHPRRLQILFFYPCFQQHFPTWHAIRRNFIVRISMRVSWFWNPVRLSGCWIRGLDHVGSDAVATNVMAMGMKIGTPYVFFASWILSDTDNPKHLRNYDSCHSWWMTILDDLLPAGTGACFEHQELDSVRTSKGASFCSIHFCWDWLDIKISIAFHFSGGFGCWSAISRPPFNASCSWLHTLAAWRQDARCIPSGFTAFTGPFVMNLWFQDVSSWVFECWEIYEIWPMPRLSYLSQIPRFKIFKLGC